MQTIIDAKQQMQLCNWLQQKVGNDFTDNKLCRRVQKTCKRCLLTSKPTSFNQPPYTSHIPMLQWLSQLLQINDSVHINKTGTEQVNLILKTYQIYPF